MCLQWVSSWCYIFCTLKGSDHFKTLFTYWNSSAPYSRFFPWSLVGIQIPNCYIWRIHSLSSLFYTKVHHQAVYAPTIWGVLCVSILPKISTNGIIESPWRFYSRSNRKLTKLNYGAYMDTRICIHAEPDYFVSELFWRGYIIYCMA